MLRLAAVLALVAVSSCASRPNILLILTDDQDYELGSLQYMPKLQRHLVQQGVSFDRFYVTVPLCCPSRSALFSGMYQHNNRVLNNNQGGGCGGRLWQHGPERLNFATYLQAAGYNTSLAGKYVNTYGHLTTGGPSRIPPGWDNWHGLVGNSEYYGYTLSNNGAVERHKKNYTNDYLPDVLLRKTLRFINRVGGKQPFFAMMSLPSCHLPAPAAPKYQALFPDVHAPRTPAFGFNASGSGMHWLQEQGGMYPFDDNAIEFLDLIYRRRLQSLVSVDDAVGHIIHKLTGMGILDNTYIVYTSDNGFHLGSHRFTYDKRQPWDTDTHVPLIMRGPGIPKYTSSRTMANMVDLTATLLDMAGAPVPTHFDGESLLPAAVAPAETPQRTLTLFESQGENNDGWNPRDDYCLPSKGYLGVSCSQASNYSLPPFLSSHNHPICICNDATNNTFYCLRGFDNKSFDFRYCEFVDHDGTVEYIDYKLDPYELVNRASSMDPALRQALHARLREARRCVGSRHCRHLLSQPLYDAPSLPSFTDDKQRS
jgi:N-acetylglucosamine-6-sulfatase